VTNHSQGSPESRPRVYKFSSFELDTRAAELRKHGIPIRLQEQPFRILLHLLERRGEVVLRTEIQQKLWPNGTVVEFGHGISAAIQRLRDALSETAGSPRHIETVPRRGYRFIGEVEVVESDGPGKSAVMSSSPTSPDLTGALISHFRVIEKLGAGTMGVVYRAEDLRLGRNVALKVLADGFVGSVQARKRFEREARAASALNHPHVCTIYEVGEHNGQPLISMELLEGETIAAVLEKGPIPMERALKLAIQLTDALDAAHRKGIIHGDLKPENLLITASGIKVLDFGLAEVGPESDDDRGFAGTPHYMAPEQIEGRRPTAQSDIFSLGLVLLEMFAGRQAVRGDDGNLTECPPRLARILRRCMETSPSDRWISVADVKLELEQCLNPTPPPSARSRLIAVSVSGIAMGIVLSIVAAWELRAPAPLVYKLSAPSAPDFIPQRAESTEPVAPSTASRNKKQPEPSLLNIQAPGGMNITRINISPDGRNLAYVAGGRLYLRSLDEADSIPLFGTEHAGTPFWSPDGANVAFVANGTLKTVGRANSVPMTLGEIKTNIGGTWGDRDILIGAIGDGIFRIPAAGGAAERLTEVDRDHGESRHLAPQFLPGNRRFLYVAGSVENASSTLYAGSLDSPERHPIMPVESNAVFVPEPRGSEQGFLLQVRGRMLIGQAFNSRTLQVSGETFPIVEPVLSNVASGAATRLGDFSAAGDAIAYRSTAAPVTPLFRFEKTAAMKNENTQLTVIRNWMARVPR
jgi:serine/threonine protein kinase